MSKYKKQIAAVVIVVVVVVIIAAGLLIGINIAVDIGSSSNSKTSSETNSKKTISDLFYKNGEDDIDKFYSKNGKLRLFEYLQHCGLQPKWMQVNPSYKDCPRSIRFEVNGWKFFIDQTIWGEGTRNKYSQSYNIIYIDGENERPHNVEVDAENCEMKLQKEVVDQLPRIIKRIKKHKNTEDDENPFPEDVPVFKG